MITANQNPEQLARDNFDKMLLASGWIVQSKKPGLSLKEVLEHIAMGNKDEDLLITLANRLIRLDKQINDKEKAAFSEKANGKTINQVVKQLLDA